MTTASEHIQFPQSPFVGPDGYIALEWQQWLLNPQFITINFAVAVDVASGGTGLTSGTSGGILGFTGLTTLASSALLAQHGLVIGGGAGATPATPVGLGTTTTVLHGNAAGDPSYGAVTAADAPTLATIAYVDAKALTSITSSLGADVALNNVANFFDGPSVAQGASGTWLVTGSVTVNDTAGAATLQAKLWDGTTVIDSGRAVTSGANNSLILSLSGILTSPAGNLRISVRDASSTSGAISFNITGTSKDSTITAVQIAP